MVDVTETPNGRGNYASARDACIGVVTVTYNSASVLADFLDSVAGQSCRNFILYVVDNASSDDTLRICSVRKGIQMRILSNDHNVGVAEGNNQGIRAALSDGCDAVLLLNNDTVFSEELFDQLWQGLSLYGCLMTTPKIYFHADANRIWAAGGYFQRKFGYRAQHYGMRQIDRGQFNCVRTVTYTPTCCVLIHRDVFARIGLMDPAYFVYVDDVDFMYRAWKAGIEMKYLPYVVLRHKVSSITGGMSEFTVRYTTRNRMYFIRKHIPVWARFWMIFYWAYYALRVLARRDTVSLWKLKQSSVSEGWRLHNTTATG